VCQRAYVSLIRNRSDEHALDERFAGAERNERLLRLLHSAYRLLQAEHTQRALQQREESRLHGPDAVRRQRRRLAFQRLRRRIRHRSVFLAHS